MRALLLLLMCSACHAQVYRCGNVYTDEKCDGAVVVKNLNANVLQAVDVPISEFRYRPVTHYSAQVYQAPAPSIPSPPMLSRQVLLVPSSYRPPTLYAVPEIWYPTFGAAPRLRPPFDQPKK